MTPSETIVVVTLIFLLAGTVKGVIGFGLPFVSVALMTAIIGLTEAMALMLAPALVTNLWQALAGEHLRTLGQRLWSLLLGGALCVWIATGSQVRADTAIFPLLLGLVLCLYSALSLTSFELPQPGSWETWLSPLMGAASGVITGLTGVPVIPAALYLHALRLPRDMLVQAVGLWFTVAIVSLGAALAHHGLLPSGLATLSAMAVLPALAGMGLGQRLRRRLPEQYFQRVFLLGLALLGAYTALRALGV